MFLPASFNPTSFSRVSFNGASQPVVQDGRSGYWRLFYYQLQEEALKEKPPANVVKEVKPSPVVKKKAKPRRVEKEEVEEAIPFRPLPMFERKEIPENHISDTWRITIEIRMMVALFQQNQVKLRGTLRFNIIEDDEEDLELLLLAA
mgnify:CR=1 FL=1